MKSEYKKEFAEQFLEYTSQGLSPKVCAKRFGVKYKIMEAWSNDPRKAEFGKAWPLGFEAWEAWWDERLNKMAQGEKGNIAGVIYYMKCNFKRDWKDDGTNNSLDVNIRIPEKDLDRKLELFAKQRLINLPKSSWQEEKQKT